MSQENKTQIEKEFKRSLETIEKKYTAIQEAVDYRVKYANIQKVCDRIQGSLREFEEALLNVEEDIIF